MAAFKNLKEIRAAATGALREAPNAAKARQWIRALPGPSTARGGVGGMVTDDLPIAPTGMYFDIPEITVTFSEGGFREARFLVAQGHDGPTQWIEVYWGPGFLTPFQAVIAYETLFKR